MLSGKTILIGITGGIAAYKICELIRMFKRQNANVRIICTPNAMNFVTKLTLQNLSQNEVGIEEFVIPDFKPEHISYADEADIMLIAPATANTIGKIANGICDNLLTSVVCAFKKNILIGNGPLSFQNKYVGTYPHNIILEVMCDFGLVGVTVIIYILVIAIKQFLKSISDFKNNKWKIYVFVSAYLPQFLLYTTFYLNGILLFCFMTIILPFTSTLCLKKEREFRNAKNNGY